MKLTSQSADGSRNGSVSAMATLKAQKKSGLSMVQTIEYEEDSDVTPVQRKKWKRNAFAGFFRDWSSGKVANQARYKASKVITPESPKDQIPAKAQMKSFQIDQARVEQLMGKPNEVAQPGGANTSRHNAMTTSRSERRQGERRVSAGRGIGGGRRRILSAEEARSMFVGAPYFSMSKTSTGYQPEVVFVDEDSNVHAARSSDFRALQGTSVSGAELGTTSFENFLQRSVSGSPKFHSDAASQPRISTLLKHTEGAVEDMGGVANLRGGCVYQGRSYWSKTSTVGRVMAAAKGGREHKGWVSVAGVLQGQTDDCLEVEVQGIPRRDASTKRITDPDAVGRISDPMSHGDYTAAHQENFCYPHDGLPVMGNEVRSQGLALVPSPEAVASLVASLSFVSPINSKLSKLEVPLLYDIQFVSSFPCYSGESKSKGQSKSGGRPKQGSDDDCMPSEFLAEGMGPELEPQGSARCFPKRSSSMADEAVKEATTPSCHPLHVDYRFEVVPVAMLLSAPLEQLPQAITIPKHRELYADGVAREVVIVLDCRGTEDLQLLGRAWCARVGQNAIVAKTDRTCLACSIREAKALGMSVVIRI